MKKMGVVRGLSLLVALWTCLGTGSAMAGAEEGEKIFGKKCMVCHSLGETHGPMAQLGGSLDGVGSKRDAAWLKACLIDPLVYFPSGKFPKQNFTDKELDDLVAYLLSLK
jgi:nitric oxide reductase subunit C